MTPMMRMPVLRQICRTPEGPWWQRLWNWCRAEAVYELVEDFDYTTSALGGGIMMVLHVPAGFRFDGASTPRLTWLFGYRPDALLLIPGLYHDFAYRHGYVMAAHRDERGWRNSTICLDKGQSDKMMKRMMREITRLSAPAVAAYVALALFGWPAWWANAKYREAARKTGELQLHGDYRDEE